MQTPNKFEFACEKGRCIVNRVGIFLWENPGLPCLSQVLWGPRMRSVVSPSLEARLLKYAWLKALHNYSSGLLADRERFSWILHLGRIPHSRLHTQELVIPPPTSACQSSPHLAKDNFL